MDLMERTLKPKAGWKEYYALLLVMASFVVLMTEVVLRYVIGSSMEWTDEISRLLLVWMTFTGIGLVILERKEIFAQVFSQRLSTRAKNLWSFFIDLLVFAFNLFLVIYGMQMTHFSWDIRSESLELPFSYFYVSIPLGALLAIFYLGQRIRKNWAGQGGSEK
jgi:TRAP-type C4-dicarboxylate transport system permease small subunit